MTERIWLKSYPEGVPANIDTSVYGSLVELLDESYRKYAARTAYSFMGQDIRYGQADTQSQAFAAYLQSLGLAKGSSDLPKAK